MNFLDFWNSLKVLFTTSPSNPNMTGPLEPLIQYLGTTDAGLTVANKVVYGGWVLMLGVADALLALLVIIGCLQMLVSQNTGSLYVPVGQFVTKIITTTLLMHLSFYIGQELFLLNNTLCGTIHVDILRFILEESGGKVSSDQNAILSFVMMALFLFVFIRLLFQAFERIVMFDLLLMFAPLAIVLSFHPQTTSAFAFWARTWVVVTFEQFIQFLAIGLSIQLLVDSGQGGLNKLLIAIAMMFLAAKIPSILSRFATSAGANVTGVGALVRAGMQVASVMR